MFDNFIQHLDTLCNHMHMIHSQRVKALTLFASWKYIYYVNQSRPTVYNLRSKVNCKLFKLYYYYFLFWQLEECGVNEILVSNLRTQGYSSPTPIQMQAWPLMLQGREVLGCAPTGSGNNFACIHIYWPVPRKGQKETMPFCSWEQQSWFIFSLILLIINSTRLVSLLCILVFVL